MAMVSDADMNRATDPEPPRPRVKFPKYTVEWSEEDQGFVATCDWFPSMSWIEPDCVEALSKYADMLLEHFGE